MSEDLVVRTVAASPLEPYPGLDDADWAHSFLHAYESADSLGNISKSSKAAGVSRALIDKRRKEDAVFAAYLLAIDDQITDAVVEAYVRLITQGASRGVYQRGELMETITEWDPKAMQWWLERKRPEEYHLPTRIELVQSGADSDAGFTFRMGDRTLIDDAEFEDIETETSP